MYGPQDTSRFLPDQSAPAGGPQTLAPATAPSFAPFEQTFLCAGCNRPLQLYVQPLHAQTEIRCPRCSRNLTAQIRRAIAEHNQRAHDAH